MNSSLIAKGQSDCGCYHYYEIDGISIVCSRLSIRQRQIIQTEIQEYLPKMKSIQEAMDEERHDEVEEQIAFSERLNKNGMDFMMDVRTERGYINWEFLLPEDM